MANLNKVFLLGNLTRDPELCYTPNGIAVANFGLAINRSYTTQGGEHKQETCFVRVVVFGKQAENCNQYLQKGRLIFIEGRLQYRSWEADGKKRSTLDIVADRVQFLGKEKEKEKEPVSEIEESASGEEAVVGEQKDIKDAEQGLPF